MTALTGPAQRAYRARRPQSPGGAGLHTTAALVLLGLIIGCSDPAGPGRVRSRVTFDVSAITGGAALGNGASVVAGADLRVTPANNANTVVLAMQVPLTSTDSLAVFDVELEPGSYVIRGTVFSNSNALLYEGSVAQTIEDDGFVVEIVMLPRDAVMVVAPRVANQPSAFDVRNVGSDTLVWSIACIRDPAQPTTCIPPNALGLTSRTDTLPAGLVRTIPAQVRATGRRLIEFVSNVGTVTIDVTW